MFESRPTESISDATAQGPLYEPTRAWPDRCSPSAMARVRRAQAGDAAAQTWLFRTYAPRVYRWARVLGRPGPASDDIVQDVFIEVFKSRSVFRGDSGIEGWLYTITRHRVVRRPRLVDQLIQSTDAPPEIPDHGRGFPDPLLRERFWSAFGRLSPAQREILLLVDMEERSGPEVARMLEIPEGTVRSRLRDGRAALKRALKRRGLFNAA